MEEESKSKNSLKKVTFVSSAWWSVRTPAAGTSSSLKADVMVTSLWATILAMMLLPLGTIEPFLVGSLCFCGSSSSSPSGKSSSCCLSKMNLFYFMLSIILGKQDNCRPALLITFNNFNKQTRLGILGIVWYGLI